MVKKETKKDLALTSHSISDFQPGMMVMYVSGIFEASQENPLIKSRFECQGEVAKINKKDGLELIEVEWENGFVNEYRPVDLEFVYDGGGKVVQVAQRAVVEEGDEVEIIGPLTSTLSRRVKVGQIGYVEGYDKEFAFLTIYNEDLSKKLSAYAIDRRLIKKTEKRVLTKEELTVLQSVYSGCLGAESYNAEKVDALSNRIAALNTRIARLFQSREIYFKSTAFYRSIIEKPAKHITTIATVKSLIGEDKFYTSIEIREGGILALHTSPVVIEYRRVKYTIGEMDITIDLVTKDIRVNNTTNKRWGYDHPHIIEQRCCFGTYHESISSALGNVDIPLLLSILHQYLIDVNDQGWYIPVGVWEHPEDQYCEKCRILRSVCRCSTPPPPPRDNCSVCGESIEECECERCPVSGELLEDVECGLCRHWNSTDEVCTA